jgi:hypothetical protein
VTEEDVINAAVIKFNPKRIRLEKNTIWQVGTVEIETNFRLTVIDLHYETHLFGPYSDLDLLHHAITINSYQEVR